jgi:pentatricopeptide repeat protein
MAQGGGGAGIAMPTATSSLICSACESHRIKMTWMIYAEMRRAVIKVLSFCTVMF